MKRLWMAGLLLAVACTSVRPTAPPQPAPRTPLPTWSLPFGPSPAPGAEPAPPGPAELAATPGTTPGASPTASPTARPGLDPTLGASTPDPFTTLVTPIPEPAPQMRFDPGVVNILLLGRDTARDSTAYRTDVMIVVSVNKAAESVTLLTLPRDLLVYIPGWTMNRLNTAAVHGDLIGYPGGGVALLEQTILYNLGIPIHGWARIDFAGFRAVIDLLGGVDVPVTCAMQDWRLKDPYNAAVDVQDADNWSLFTVAPGVQHMDGDLALWYARSRKRSSDFDRSRRQHQVLRAILERGLQLDMLPRAPELFSQMVQIVDTDLGLGDALQFVPLAARLERARIKSRFIGRSEVTSWTTPGGAMVLLPNQAAISAVLAEAFAPPPANTLARGGPVVEVWNGTPNSDLAVLAADNLTWSGITPAIGPAARRDVAHTRLYDFSLSPKGSLRPELQRLFNLADADVTAAPDPAAAYPYRVVLGADFNSCAQPAAIVSPLPAAAPTAAAPPAEDVHAARVLEPPPAIDGDLSEWARLVYPAAQPSFGAASWVGPTDLSGSWNAAWDDQFLYLALKVRDDVRLPPPSGEALFRGDTLEVWLSVDPAGRGPALSEHELQLGLSPGDYAGRTTPPEAFLWMPQGLRGPVRDARIAAQAVEGGYALEAAVPWSVFRVAPSADQRFAFVLALDDDDTPGAADQESQVVSVKGAVLTDPRTWGALVLDPAP